MYLACIKFINSVSLNVFHSPGPRFIFQLGKNRFVTVA